MIACAATPAMRNPIVSIAVHNYRDLPAMRHRLDVELRQRGASAREAHDVLLAVHEATKNALNFTAPRPVQVTVRFLSGWVILCIADGGSGFDVSNCSLDAFPDPEAISGRGLALMHHLVDHVEVLCWPDGAVVRMQKRLSLQTT
jgi:anti-sigma regulatory factor (Ser/Thr protein kinase)